MHPPVEPPDQPGSLLGKRLRDLRRAAGLTQQQIAADLSWVTSKISKIERGDQMPKVEDIEAWTAACSHPEVAGDLLDLLEDARSVRRQSRTRAARSQAGLQLSVGERFKAASRIREVAPMAIPGLLQTAGYARAIQAQVAAVYGAGDIDAAIQVKLRWQQEFLYDQGKELQFIVTEAALRMPPCPVPVMLGQLDRLLAVLDLDNVTLAVIPMGAELSLAPFFGFRMLDDTVIVEDYLGDNDITSSEDVAVFDRIFGLLMAEAVTGDDARRLIMAASASLREGSAS